MLFLKYLLMTVGIGMMVVSSRHSHVRPHAGIALPASDGQ